MCRNRVEEIMHAYYIFLYQYTALTGDTDDEGVYYYLLKCVYNNYNNIFNNNNNT